MQIETPITFRKARDLGDVINVTFRFLRQNAGALCKYLLYIVGPAIGGLVLGGILLFGNIMNISAGGSPSLSGPLMLLAIPLLLISIVLIAILPVLVINSYAVLYQDRGRGAFEVRDVWELCRARFWKVVGAMLLLGVGYLILGAISIIPCLGTIVYFVGVVYMAVTFTPAFPVLVREDSGVVEALKRSKALVEDHWWTTLGILLVATIIYYILVVGAFIPVIAVGFAFGLNGIENAGALTVIPLTLTSIVGYTGLVVLQAIPNTAIIFQYYNLIERKEHTGLMGRVDALDGAEAAATPSKPPAGRGEEEVADAPSASEIQQPTPDEAPDQQRWGPSHSGPSRGDEAGT